MAANAMRMTYGLSCPMPHGCHVQYTSCHRRVALSSGEAGGRWARVEVRVSVRFGGGLLPTTSHFIFYSEVGLLAIFSHCQP